MSIDDWNILYKVGDGRYWFVTGEARNAARHATELLDETEKTENELREYLRQKEATVEVWRQAAADAQRVTECRTEELRQANARNAALEADLELLQLALAASEEGYEAMGDELGRERELSRRWTAEAEASHAAVLDEAVQHLKRELIDANFRLISIDHILHDGRDRYNPD